MVWMWLDDDEGMTHFSHFFFLMFLVGEASEGV